MTAILALALIAFVQSHAWLPAALCAVPLAFAAGRRVGHRDAGKGLVGLYVRRRLMGRAS